MVKKMVLAITIIVNAVIVRACDCNDFIGLKDAKNVFIGRLESIKKIEQPFYRYEISFFVDSSIKGPKLDKITINVNCLQDGCCGYNFDFYSTYEVYTYYEGTLLYTGACTNTRKLER